MKFIINSKADNNSNQCIEWHLETTTNGDVILMGNNSVCLEINSVTGQIRPYHTTEFDSSRVTSYFNLDRLASRE